MTPPFAVEWLGYTLWAWLVLSIYIVSTFLFRKNSGVPWQFAVYLLFMSFSAFMAERPLRAFLGIHGTYNNGIAQLLLVVAASSLRIDAQHCRRIVRGAIVAMSLQALLQFAIPYSHWLTPSGYWAGRAYAPLGSPVYLGAFLAIAGVWCLPSMTWIERFCLVTSLMATKTRGAMAAFVIGLVYANRRRINFYAIAPIVAVGAILVGSQYYGRLSATRSDSYRLSVWRACAHSIQQRPWMGWGPENAYFAIQKNRDKEFDALYGVTTQDQCHNQVLEAAVTGGIPFAIFSLILMVFIFGAMTGDSGRGVAICYFVLGSFNPIPLSVQVLSALIFGANLRKSATFPLRPIWLATVSLVAALYCARCSVTAHDVSLPASVRYSAARIIGIVD